MTHCVPNWDSSGGDLDVLVSPTEYLPSGKGRQPSNAPSGWTDTTEVNTKPNVTGFKNDDWQVNCAKWSGRQEAGDAVTPSKPPSQEPMKDGVLAVNVPVLDPLDSNYMADDEMTLWLQYPLDASLEKNYCSEFFGLIPTASASNMQAMKESLSVGPSSNRSVRNLPIASGGVSNPRGRVVSAEEHMALGAGRAAGVLEQPEGVEAFSTVKTQQSYPGKWPRSATDSAAAKTIGSPAILNSSSPSGRTSAPIVPGVGPSAFPSLKTLPLHPARKGMNFPHFSGPVVAMKQNLQNYAVGSQNVPVQGRMKSPYVPTNPPNANRPFDISMSSASSMAESTTTRQGSPGASGNGADVHVEGSVGQQRSLATESSWPSSMHNSLVSKDAETAVNSTGNRVDPESRPAADVENRQDSGDAGNTMLSSAPTKSSELPELPEATLTSSSGGSGNSGKGAINRGKRRGREQEESECQSDCLQDADEEVTEMKKQPPRATAAKRTRAAEVHNLSERRRRDRINEKMKALQELIPNSNKADKASMLDEAIQYLKMLQVQLQMMSMRSGMSIPSMIPSGMQHLHVPQMAGMPTMGMGMGMGLGMGMTPMVGLGGMAPMGHPMGMHMDMNSMAGGRSSHLLAPHLGHGGASHSGSPLMPHPSHGGGASYNVSQVMPHSTQGGSAHNVSATSPAVSVVDPNELRLQSNSALESVYLTRQPTLQMTQQTTMDVYQAYMIHQQQQHQQQQQQQHQQQQQQQHQQQQQQQQQQHQQHQLQQQQHQQQLPSNIGGGVL